MRRGKSSLKVIKGDVGWGFFREKTFQTQILVEGVVIFLIFHSLCYIFSLRNILRRIQNGEVPKEDLYKNLEYAASVLESVYVDETRWVLSVTRVSHLCHPCFCGSERQQTVVTPYCTFIYGLAEGWIFKDQPITGYIEVC